MLQILQNQITEIEKTISTMENLLSKKEFQEYCDHAYSCISYLQQCINNLIKKQND